MANTVLSRPDVESLRCCLSETLGRCYQNPECFQLNSEQCKLMCDALACLSAALSDFVYRYPNAWKEIYRAVKEAEIYLHHCSSVEWPIQFLTRSTTGEGYSLHIHDLALYRLFLDVIHITNGREIHWKICNFCQEMDRMTIIRHEYVDEVQLFKICKQFAERSTHTTEDKNIVRVSNFLGGKLKGIIPIPVSTEVESVGADTPIPKWLEIDPADLVLNKDSEAIGEGSFGSVYEGSWLGIRVAAKEMPKEAWDLFELEASILAKLQSPFIVQLIGTCIKDSHLYLVMEYVSSNLERLLEDRSKGEKPPFSLPVAVDIMLQISRAMEYLHSQGIMHLDLKSSNVLYELSSVPESRKKGYGRVKLCDFGSASKRLFSSRNLDPKGTCYWRAPEAFPPPYEDMSAENYSPQKYTNKADVYSFAMTCYEILTGKQPFDGVLPADLYGKIMNGERPSLKSSICPFILTKYIEQCWDTDPDHRPCFEAVSYFLRTLKLCILKSPFDWNKAYLFSDKLAVIPSYAWELETALLLKEAPKSMTEMEVPAVEMIMQVWDTMMKKPPSGQRMLEAWVRLEAWERLEENIKAWEGGMEEIRKRISMTQCMIMETRERMMMEEEARERRLMEKEGDVLGQWMEARERRLTFSDNGWKLGRGWFRWTPSSVNSSCFQFSKDAQEDGHDGDIS